MQTCNCGDELKKGDALCTSCWTTIRDNWQDNYVKVADERDKLQAHIDSWKQEELLWKEQEAALIAERDRYKALLETIAAWPCLYPEYSPDCPVCLAKQVLEKE